MDYKEDFVTRKKTGDGLAVYYPYWSPKFPVNRYSITGSVPSRPGIFRLFYKDDKGHEELFYMERVWYGGLRAEIRRATDPAEVSDPARRSVLEKYSCRYSYTIVETKPDMLDLLSAYSELLLPQGPLRPRRADMIKLLSVNSPLDLILIESD